MERNEFYDVVKGVAIMLVALGHSIQILNPLWTDMWMSKLIYMMHMPLFVLLSGKFFYYSVAKKSLIDFIKGKLFRLYIPSVSWGVIGVLIVLLGKLIKHSVEYDVMYFIELVFTGMWFLTVLFLFSVIGALINVASTKYKYFLWFIIWSTLYLCPCFWMRNEAVFLMPFFVLAIMFRKYDWSRIPIGLGVISLVIYALCTQFWSFDCSLYKMDADIFTWQYHYKAMIRFVSGFFGSVSVLFICSLLKNIHLFVRYMSFVGGVTLPIYVIHQKLLTPIKVIGFQSDKITIMLLCAFLIVSFSVMLYYILRKILILRIVLFGEK